MRAAPNKRWWGLALIAFPACAQVLSLDDFGEAGTGTGTGGTGPHCETAEDCAEVTPACFEANCDNGTCGRTAMAPGAACNDDGVCDEAGNCRTAIGGDCDAADECVTASCVDGVCCGEPACDVCFECGGAECMLRPTGSEDDACDGACDGDGGCARGTLAYGKILGVTGEQVFYDLALLDDGGAVAVGAYRGALTLGGTPLLVDSTNYNALVVKFDALGEILWAHGGGSVDYDDVAYGVSVAPDGTIAVVGQSAVGSPSGFVGIYDPTGTPIGAVPLPGASVAFDVAFVGNELLVAGRTQSAPFLARYSHAGAEQGKVGLGTNVNSYGAVRRLKLAKDGGVLLVGWVQGKMALGNGLLASDQDGFVAKLDADLNGQWLVPIASIGADYAIDVAEAPNGDVVVGGFYSGAIPELEFTPSTLKDARSGFVVRLSAEGKFKFANGLVGDGDAVVYAVEADAHGNVVALGSANGKVDLGGGLVAASDAAALQTTPSPADGFVSKYAANGTYLWGRTFGVAGSDGAYALAVEPGTDAVLLVGFATTDASIDGVKFTGTDPDRGALIARLEP